VGYLGAVDVAVPPSTDAPDGAVTAGVSPHPPAKHRIETAVNQRLTRETLSYLARAKARFA